MIAERNVKTSVKPSEDLNAGSLTARLKLAIPTNCVPT